MISVAPGTLARRVLEHVVALPGELGADDVGPCCEKLSELDVGRTELLERRSKARGRLVSVGFRRGLFPWETKFRHAKHEEQRGRHFATQFHGEKSVVPREHTAGANEARDVAECAEHEVFRS